MLWFNEMKNISIRGRVGYGTICLATTLDACGLVVTYNKKLVASFMKYTEYAMLDEWEESHDEVSPSDLADYTARVQAGTTADVAFCYGLISLLEDVATGNLYAGVTGGSKETLSPVVEITKRLNQKGIALPPIGVVTQSKFSLKGGWGEPFTLPSDCLPRSFTA